MADYDVLPYDSSVTADILPLLQVTLGNSGAVRKTEDFWRWKHESNPFGASHGLYAWDDAEALAIGLRVLMRWHFRDPANQELRAARAVDTATHPNYQRRGIFSMLTRQAVDSLAATGTHLIFNTPNQKSLPGYLKMGWQVAARWRLFLCPLHPLRMLVRRVRPLASARIDFHDFFGEAILGWETFAERHAEAAALVSHWEAAREQVGLRTVRDWDYLQWRYGRHPHIRYAVFPFPSPDQPDSLAGFAILRPNLRFGWQEVVLTELFLSRREVGLAKRLLRALAIQVRGDYLIAHFARRSLERAALWRSGYLPVPGQDITFTVRSLQPGHAGLATPAAWDLTLGDLELF